MKPTSVSLAAFYQKYVFKIWQIWDFGGLDLDTNGKKKKKDAGCPCASARWNVLFRNVILIWFAPEFHLYASYNSQLS